MKLTQAERTELTRRAGARSLKAEATRRARCILLLSDGCTWSDIRDVVGCNDSLIARWSKRFESDRLAGLFSRQRGSEVRALTPELEARILERTRQSPPNGSAHWSMRKLAKAVGTHHMNVARVWARHGLRPHRLQRYVA